MYEYRLNIVTNDYQFLFRFALETNALIEPSDFDTHCNCFTLCYTEELEYKRAEALLSSILQDA